LLLPSITVGTGPTATPENHPESIEVPPCRGKNLTLLGGSLLLPSLASFAALFCGT